LRFCRETRRRDAGRAFSITKRTIRGFAAAAKLVFAAVILSQRENPEITTTGRQKRLGLRAENVAVVGNDQTIFRASLANALGTRVVFRMEFAFAVGGGAAGRPRSVAGDIGKEL
jgi:hypothetical protein